MGGRSGEAPEGGAGGRVNDGVINQEFEDVEEVG